MIIAHICSGLGNQLFQYAAARRLADSRNAELKLDITTFYENQSPQQITEELFLLRYYALNHFNIKAGIATEDEILSFRVGAGERGDSAARGTAGLSSSSSNGPLIVERSPPSFESALLDAPSHCYIQGYWQSEKYFLDIANLIRSELSLRFEPNAANAVYLRQIESCTSVSLHVRRGDKAFDAKSARVHGAIPLEYYREAIRLIGARVANPEFFIFSEDREWASEFLKIPYPNTIVDSNGGNAPQEDLRLMSHCRHHIISNSSYSWWSAWLGNAPDKLVVAPLIWAHNSAFQNKDLIPNGWETINVSPPLENRTPSRSTDFDE